jgi:hypothetical protein
MISKSPSLIIHVSYVYGLSETLIILTFKGRSGAVEVPTDSVGQGSSLQGSVLIASP